ncbi:MAG: Sua5/YciO/YrdC/YwlC family protein, partial [Candidatus Cryosericum sp.]
MPHPETVLLDTCSDADVHWLSERIAAGAIAVFPTDTVYGIGCNAACVSSVGRVFAVKHRDAAKPLPVFTPGIARVLLSVQPAERDLAQ